MQTLKFLDVIVNNYRCLKLVSEVVDLNFALAFKTEPCTQYCSTSYEFSPRLPDFYYNKTSERGPHKRILDIIFIFNHVCSDQRAIC
jgi:hypothetical protein